MRFAVIGSNFISDWFIEAGKTCEKFELGMIYSRTEQRAKEYAARHQAKLWTTSLEEVASSSQIDAVYVASPTMCHAQQAAQMMKAGKHVLCEKPMTSNLKEFRFLKQTAEENGVVLLEAMRPEYSPGAEVIRNHLQLLGKIRRVSFRFCQYSSRYDKFKAGIVENAFNPKLSNGAVMDIGVYPIHMMVSLFGKPERVIADVIKLENGVDGAGSLLCSYDGFQGEIAYSKITDCFVPSEIQGENGSMLIDKISNPGRIEICYRNGRREVILEQAPEHDMRYEILRFMDYAEKNQFPKEDLEKTEMTMEVIDEIRRQADIVFPADCLSL